MQEPQLSKRERQIMDIVYAHGSATAMDVLKSMKDAPSRNAVRTFLTILEQKGYLRHRQEGKAYIYSPTRPRQSVGKSALRRVIDVFFNGSFNEAVTAHLMDPQADVSTEDLDRLSKLIEQARKKGR